MHSITHHGSDLRNILVITVRENTSGHEAWDEEREKDKTEKIDTGKRKERIHRIDDDVIRDKEWETDLPSPIIVNGHRLPSSQ